MLKPLLIFPWLVWALSTNAQVREITGLVTYNNERQSGVIIKNLSSNTQTVSNDRGEFDIKAKSGDTLLIAKADFIKDSLSVADQPYLIIQVNKNPLMLKEVVINGTAITPVSAFDANKKAYKDIYWKGDKSHMVSLGPTISGVAGLGVSLDIDKLYSALSKQGKDARRLQHTLTKDYKNSIVDKRFNPLAVRITGYRGKKLSDFIMINRPSYEMVVNATDYDIVQYIKAKLPGSKHK